MNFDGHSSSFRRDAMPRACAALAASSQACYNAIRNPFNDKNKTGENDNAVTTRRDQNGSDRSRHGVGGQSLCAGLSDTAGAVPGWLSARRLSERLGQQFVIENKPGAGNNIGTEAAINSPPDGYTVLLVNPANYINTTLYANLKFDFVRDIAPIASFNRVPNVMTINKDVPAKNVAEFFEYVKANPGKINMASSGNGTSVHLSGEMFMSMTGVKMQHVPYRGAAPAITDMLGGQVQVIFDNMPSIIQHIRSGSLRALGVTTAERSSQLPDVQAIAETVPGYEASALFGMGAPKSTPKDIIEKLNSEINAIMHEPDMRKRLVELGGEPLIQSPAAFGDMIKAETAKWKKVVEFAGLKVE
jgi:tripartite-type tricarboxylate transporter receptor subunit TctC